MRSSNQWLIDLSKNESLWAKDIATVPSMIHFEYTQLKILAEQGQVYGVLLQCKDTYETILRIPVIMALVVIDSDPKYKDGSEYNDIMKAFLESPMSMGNWNNLARVIIKNNKKLNLPENLIKILERTRKLYNTEITTKVSDVVAWRNDTIGHGALKFEDDANYQEEVKSLLNLLKEYFDGEGKLSIKRLYDSIYFQCGENKLVGDCYDKNAEHDLFLHIAGNSYIVSNYINDCDLKWYLFESFYCRKNLVKYSSYIDGKNNTVQNKYFADLYERHVLQGNKDVAVASDYISRAEDLILEYLNMPTDYVKPEKLVELLQEQMDTLGKGVITIFMERGTGKSAFSNQLSGFYHSKPLLKNTLSRCYHVSNAALRGVSDFINSINNGFRHSFNPADDLWGSTEELPSLTLESEKPAEDMAEFLNFYHDKYRKDYTILVIDGVDETTEQSECIMNYIPSKEQLDDGVFVVLTTRFVDEETVQGKSKKYIEKATQLADGQLKIRRHDEINTELLKRYIEKHENRFGLNNTIDKDALIEKSDYRILYLRAYLAMKDQVALDSTNETTFIESYMNYLLSFYGINQRQQLKEIAVSIALFPSISIKKYQEYLNCQEITYEFVGLFNDLLPLLTIVHLDGEDCYEFADAAYEDFVIEEYPDVVRDVARNFYESLNTHLSDYLENGSELRELWLDLKNDEIIFNRKLVFFSEGLLGLWNKSYKCNIISELFYNNFIIIYLLKRMVNDTWAKFGYGLCIKNEIINCIVKILYFSLTNNDNVACLLWTKKLNKLFNDLNFVNIDIVDNQTTKMEIREYFDLNNLKESIKTCNNFAIIVDYLLSNYTHVADFTDWYWIFVPKYNDVKFSCENIPITIFEVLGCTDSYVAYMLLYLHCCEQNRLPVIFFKDEWAYRFLKVKISPETEEKLLNYLLAQTIKYDDGDINGKSYKEIAKECFDCIQDKKYNLTACNGDRSFVLKKLEEKNEIITSFIKEVHLAIQSLLKFQPLSDTEFELIGLTACTEIESTNNDDVILLKENKKDLYVAFYKRLCYERDNGTLVDFCNNYRIDNAIQVNFVKIIKSACCEKEFIGELREWVNAFELTANKEKTSTFFLLSIIIVLVVKAMENNEHEDEALEVLERFVYRYDTVAFFAFILQGNDKTLSNIVFEMPEMVYCTENALYLLKRYYEIGKIHKAAKLLEIMEKAVIYIEKSVFDFFGNNKLEIYYQTLARTDIQKYRFMSLRQRFQIENEFDNYIGAVPSNHIKKLYDLVDNISRNSDFREISFHLEMILEFYWQSKKWIEGEIYCQKILDFLNAAVCFGDKVVAQGIKNEIGKIQECNRFFMFLNGKSIKYTDNYTPLRSTSSGFGRQYALYDLIFKFQLLNCEKKEGEYYQQREWYQNLIEIGLYSYSII